MILLPLIHSQEYFFSIFRKPPCFLSMLQRVVSKNRLKNVQHSMVQTRLKVTPRYTPGLYTSIASFILDMSKKNKDVKVKL